MTTKKALLIGINYRGTSSALNGCINDVQSMKGYLLENGYTPTDIVELTDDTTKKPTRDNIVGAILNLLLSGADRLFFHYSGHGSWEADRNGDEADRRDESLVPIDYQRNGMITDDQLRGLLTFMSPKSKLTVILDCCHSGTGIDLRYQLKTVRKRVRRRFRRRWVMRNINQWSSVPDNRYSDTPGQVIMLSGCLDVQYSADAYEEGKYQGAMTYCLLRCLREKKPKNLAQLLVQTRALLKSRKYEQVCNLTTGRNVAPTAALDII